jgi:hypothetical protein
MFQSLQDIKSERQFKALTGVSRQQFQIILEAFSACLENFKQEEYNKPINDRERRPGGGAKGKLVTPEDKLFFLLFYLKNYPTFDVLGFIFHLAPSKAHENVHKLMPILQQALHHLNVLPERSIKKLEEFKQVFEDIDKIIIDATEREHFRHPSDEEQRKHYSGKKKPIP